MTAMPYAIRRDETVADGVRRVVIEQIDRARAELADPALPRDQTVHQGRKRCKKIRAVLRLVRAELAADSTYDRENAWFRDAARELSDLRDAAVMIETYDALMDRYQGAIDRPAFAPVRRMLTLRLQELAAREADADDQLAGFGERLEAARARVASWPLRGTGFESLAPGLVKTYRRARRAMRSAAADGTVEAFHEWRKRVKYHRYHCSLLRGMWPAVLDVRHDELHRLSDLLGDDHDLAVFRTHVAGDQATAAALIALIDRRRHELQRDAFSLGERLHAEKPGRLGRRFGRIWQAWCREAPGA